MLNLYSGSFSPSLEKAFSERVKNLKKDPFSPLAVVAPSNRLANHLQDLLVKSEKSFLNIHFHTFSSLAEVLWDEGENKKKTVLSDSLFFDTLVKLIVKEDRPFPGLEDLAVPQGFPPQVRGTIRDLIDAGIPAQGPMLLDAVKEDFLGRNVDLGWLLQLLRFYQIYAQRLEALPEVTSKSEVLKEAILKAPDSPYLNQFDEILYYGFYDLTGLQKDFFEAVVKNHASSLFFPFVKDNAAYNFAGQFREQALVPILETEVNLEEKNEDSDQEAYQAKAKDIQIFNASGVRDEAWRIALEIRRYHDEHKVPYSKMAIVARNQTRLQDPLPALLQSSQIPFHTSARETLARSPQVEMAMEFLRCTDPEVYRVSLKPFMSRSDFKGPSDSKDLTIENQIPAYGSWSQMVSKAKELLERYFKAKDPQEQKVWDLMLEGLEEIARFDLLQKKISRSDFLDTVFERWTNLPWPIPGQSELGVSVLHAEAIRGLKFDVVFVMGLEERVFPRVVREDPFLRDDARFQLARLGYKINEKLAALEEEKLLFHLIVRAAQKTLFLSYQRSDEEGKIVGPSLFLGSFAEQNNLDLGKVVESLPRPLSLKFQSVNPQLLGERDVVFGYLSNGETKKALTFVENTRGNSKGLKRGLSWIEKLNQFGEPTEVDGVLSPMELRDVFPNGRVSATRLETYGRCPFQFFATTILGLEPSEDKEKGSKIPADKKGTVVHDFLEAFYLKLKFDAKKTTFPTKIFTAVFKEKVESVTAEEMELHPLLWEAHKTLMKEELTEFIKRDLEQLSEDNMKPAFFEQAEAYQLEPPLDGFEWFGKPDRIDIGEGKARILDYKTGTIAKRPLLAGLRGLKIQPSLYILLTEHFLKEKGVPVEKIDFVYQKMGRTALGSQLTYQEWLDHKPRLLDTLKSHMKNLMGGQFLIFPDDQMCQWCDVQQICRKNHGPSLQRSREGAGKEFLRIREKKINGND